MPITVTCSVDMVMSQKKNRVQSNEFMLGFPLVRSFGVSDQRMQLGDLLVGQPGPPGKHRSATSDNVSYVRFDVDFTLGFRG